MTLDPRHLHACASLWSLVAAWPRLLTAVEAGQRAADDGADLGTLRSPVYGMVRSSGGPARSAIADAIADGRSGRWISPHTRLLETTAGTVRWLGDTLLIGGADRRTTGTLTLLRARVPKIRPEQAADLARWVAEADTRIRTALGLGDDHRLLRGVQCPRCSTRNMQLRTSVPPDQQVVICGAGCICAGAECLCRMGVRAAGVAHIWTRAELEQPITKEN